MKRSDFIEALVSELQSRGGAMAPVAKSRSEPNAEAAFLELMRPQPRPRERDVVALEEEIRRTLGHDGVVAPDWLHLDKRTIAHIVDAAKNALDLGGVGPVDGLFDPEVATSATLTRLCILLTVELPAAVVVGVRPRIRVDPALRIADAVHCLDNRVFAANSSHGASSGLALLLHSGKSEETLGDFKGEEAGPGWKFGEEEEELLSMMDFEEVGGKKKSPENIEEKELDFEEVGSKKSPENIEEKELDFEEVGSRKSPENIKDTAEDKKPPKSISKPESTVGDLERVVVGCLLERLRQCGDGEAAEALVSLWGVGLARESVASLLREGDARGKGELRRAVLEGAAVEHGEVEEGEGAVWTEVVVGEGPGAATVVRRRGRLRGMLEKWMQSLEELKAGEESKIAKAGRLVHELERAIRTCCVSLPCLRDVASHDCALQLANGALGDTSPITIIWKILLLTNVALDSTSSDEILETAPDQIQKLFQTNIQLDQERIDAALNMPDTEGRTKRRAIEHAAILLEEGTGDVAASLAQLAPVLQMALSRSNPPSTSLLNSIQHMQRAAAQLRPLATAARAAAEAMALTSHPPAPSKPIESDSSDEEDNKHEVDEDPAVLAALERAAEATGFGKKGARPVRQVDVDQQDELGATSRALQKLAKTILITHASLKRFTSK